MAALLSVSVLALLLFTFDRVQAQQDKKQQDRRPAEPQKKVEDDDQQPIRVGTQLVNVLFSVSDKQNRYINDLTKEDITILENGKPQQIFTFKKETDLPLTMALLVDVSGSEKYVLPLLKETGQHFFSSVIRQGKDTAAIVKFEGEPTLMQGLTSSLSRLRKGLEDVAYVEPPPVGVFGGPTPPINGGSRQGGTSLYDAIIATASDLLAGEAGRKTMILLTDGQDTTSRMKIGDAINEALKAEASIYAIGIGDPGFGVDEGKLKQLCEATGGRAYFPKDPRDLDRAFAELEKDLRQQYLIAYEPDNITPDGGFRRIEVRVSNRNPKDLKIRHRRGYYAPKA
jgi:VWFA-related protein